MEIQIYSDLHTEHNKSYPKIKAYCDILVLAGDIGNIKKANFKKFIEYCSQNWKHIIFVLGNHEYYGLDIKYANKKYSSYFNNFDNVYLLNDDFIEIDDYIFIGSTFWTKTTSDIQFAINDFLQIKNLTYKKYIELHEKNFSFIKNTLNNKTKNKIIMITHFPPYYFDSTKKRYPDTPEYIKNYFGNNFPIELLKNIDTWIFGHTHNSDDLILHNTRFISNQLGYSFDIDCDFNDKGIYNI